MKIQILYITKMITFILIAFSIASLSFAKSINYYEQPNDASKMLGTMDSKTGVITIYKPKDSEWVKVADPRNGNVGWIKAKDLNMADYHFNVITGGEGSNHYQIIQYGNSGPYTSEHLSKTLQKMQEQKKQLQKDMQKMMQDMLQDQDWNDFPMILPIMVVPQQSVPTTPSKEPAQSTNNVKQK